MLSYFDFLPNELSIQILEYSDFKSTSTLRWVGDSINKIIDDINTWKSIIYRRYPILYKSLGVIGELNNLESLYTVYYYYKDNVYNVKNLLNLNLPTLASNSIYQSFDSLIQNIDININNNKKFAKLLIAKNYPGSYNKILDLIPESKLDLRLNFLIYSLNHLKDYLMSVLKSLIYTSSLNNNIITNYLVNGHLDNYLVNGYLDNYPSIRLLGRISPDIFLADNYVFFWLYINDPNVDINDDIQPEETIIYVKEIAKDLNKSVLPILNKYNNQIIDTLYDSFFPELFPDEISLPKSRQDKINDLTRDF